MREYRIAILHHANGRNVYGETIEGDAAIAHAAVFLHGEVTEEAEGQAIAAVHWTMALLGFLPTPGEPIRDRGLVQGVRP